MIRLTILTIAVLFAVLTIWGDPGARQREVADTGQPPMVVPAAETSLIDALTPAQRPELIRVTEQTPQRVNPYPGPALRPSPEYQSQAQAAVADLAVPDGAEVMYVTGNRVNFRAGPSTNDAVVGALTRGTPVQVLGPRSGNWVQIRDAQGRNGYMSGDFLSSDRAR
ncbi:MAG: SH3 domain-containing protein [Paracoccus sp. (in: a-proteobacteria)]|uniref:SH3 domain-containing protein n=1 Tax=Paracoccus sp. TaxID=267 RepID=UPI0026E04750|nr:SH3 domain-containing protein [Paracoccus sp. (in: a-proteobacteria)]MDO5614174.1 SH3 domain-containing protein [Paracoccus sp. (in: a-proteobacteria)]